MAVVGTTFPQVVVGTTPSQAVTNFLVHNLYGSRRRLLYETITFPLYKAISMPSGRGVLKSYKYNKIPDFRYLVWGAKNN
jgi:hypothetical protein